MKRRLFLVLCLILLAGVVALAAFTSSDDFDGYSTSADLNTLSGGSGWTTAWISTAATWIIETAPGGGQGGNAAKNTSVASDTRRYFNPITVGTVLIRMRISITNPNDFTGVLLRQNTGGTTRMRVRFGPTGNLELYDHDTTSYVSFGAYSANTWYTIEIDFDKAGQPDLYRARKDGGSYSAWKKAEGGSYEDVANITIEANDTQTRDFWIDDIRTGTSSGGSAVTMTMLKRRQ